MVNKKPRLSLTGGIFWQCSSKIHVEQCTDVGVAAHCGKRFAVVERSCFEFAPEHAAYGWEEFAGLCLGALYLVLGFPGQAVRAKKILYAVRGFLQGFGKLRLINGQLASGRIDIDADLCIGIGVVGRIGERCGKAFDACGYTGIIREERNSRVVVVYEAFDVLQSIGQLCVCRTRGGCAGAGCCRRRRCRSTADIEVHFCDLGS